MADLAVRTALRLRIRDQASDLAVRELTPRDLGGSTGAWHTGALRIGPNRIIGTVVPIDKVIVLGGCFSLEPKPAITDSRIMLGMGGTEVRGIYALEHAYALGAHYFLFAEPVTFHRQEFLLVEAQAKRAMPKGESFGLMGVVCEPIGVNLSMPWALDTD